MRLVLVHGISQEGKTEESLKGEWLRYLEVGLMRPFASQADAFLPFYGDHLAALTDAAGQAVEQGFARSSDEEASFVADALGEQVQAAGATREAILREERSVPQNVVEQGFPMDRRINAIARVLERLSPLHGNLVLRLLRQAYAYLKKPAPGSAVDAIVRPVLDAGPAVVVSHSLGTVVTFKLLRQLALEGRPLDVPLYVTLGSPLPLLAVRAALGPSFAVPTGVRRWLNGVDPNDFIALGQGLDAPNFAGAIDNLTDIQSIAGAPHAIEGYLKDRRVALAIAQACDL
jgi:hypothetical protein